MLLQGYLDTLSSQGQSVSEGVFTISPQEARRKLAEFQLHCPERFILLLVSSAVAGGASFITLRDTQTSLSISFDGATYTAVQFEGLYSDLFRGKAGAVAMLALGVAPLVGKVEVVSVTPEGTAVWRPGEQKDEVSSHSQTGSPLNMVEVQKPNSPWSFLRTLRGYVGFGPEAKLVDKECEHSPVPITINEQLVSRPVQLGWPLLAILSGQGKANHQAAIVWDPEPANFRCALAYGTGKLEAVVHGVSFPLNVDCGLYGVVWHDGLRTDVSYRELARDVAYDQLCRSLEKMGAEVFLRITRNLQSLDDRQTLQLALQVSKNAELSGLSEGIPSEALLRLIELLTRHPKHRRARAHLLLCSAEWFQAKESVHAAGFFSDSYYFLKEVLRLEGLDLTVISWTIRALMGIGADNTTVCDWTLLGASTALSSAEFEAARAWYERLLQLAEVSERDSTQLKAAGYLGLAVCDDDIEGGFDKLESLRLAVPELRIVYQKQPKSYVEALLLYQRQLACRYREDIHHILLTRGYLDES
jgi:hypothetical protein